MRVSLLFFSFIFSVALYGQRTVSGLITDASDKEPVPGVPVFIANTSVATVTDADGRYRLAIPGEGSYQLTVSHVAYQSVTKDIEPGKASITFDVALQPHELSEVTVATKVRFRQKDINLFYESILGVKPSPKTLWVANPEAVYYFYNTETKKLTVTCREPLHITNHETGYQIDYLLNNFTHDYSTGTTDWSQHSNFIPLEPENLMQKNKWDARRREVYNISLAKFIRSLYNNKNNSLYSDGFVLASFSANPDPKDPFSLLDPDRITSEITSANNRVVNVSNEQTLLICYGRPVTAKDLDILQQTQGNVFINNNQYLMCLLHGGKIDIYPDGTYSGKLQIVPVNSANSIVRLNNVLPLEYMPEELVVGAMKSQTASLLDSITQRLDTQLKLYPQEKLHLHTDRDIYIPGEKIWFKAYLTDAETRQSSTQSRYVYVELISPKDSLVSRVMIRPENGLFYGNIYLADIVPEGNYTLRAYTKYMENQGNDCFFKKNIRIGNLKNNYELKITNYEKGTSGGNRRSDLAVADPAFARNDYEVSFFPEGGNLVEGVMCKVAFKALNRDGTSAAIAGKLVDESGADITAVATLHAGMGVFSFVPARGKRYFLQCRDTEGMEKRFELPRPDIYASALTVDRNATAFAVSVKKNPLSPDVPGYLLAQCRGKIVYFDLWDKGGKAVDFKAEELPEGIIHFLFLDSQLNTLSERLVFNKNRENHVAVDFHTDKTVYAKREKVVAALSLTDANNNILEGNLSVAITDDADRAVDSTATIQSTLLLSSELKGYIENPAWYLQDNPDAETALDFLMLTHGWRRYNIPDVVRGKIETPLIPYQTGLYISGSVQRPGIFGRTGAVTNSEVLVLLQDGGYGHVFTDLDGRFIFQDAEYPDSTTFFIQSLSNRGSNRYEIVLDRDTFPAPVHAPYTPVTQNVAVPYDLQAASGQNAFIAKAEQRARYDEDMWTIYLSGVEITARRIDKQKEEPRLQYWANEFSDATIKREVIEKFAFKNVRDYLSMISGVEVFSDGTINIRGAMTTDPKSGQPVMLPPLIIIDGISGSSIDDVSYTDVESIDVFKGHNTTVYGVRGAGGVISITTRRGKKAGSLENDKPNYTAYTPLGYQKPVEFYSPKYDTLETKNATIPDYRTTIFWKPDVVISDSGEASFEFYTSDFPTTYSVVIEGLTTDGKIVRQVEKIQVK